MKLKTLAKIFGSLTIIIALFGTVITFLAQSAVLEYEKRFTEQQALQVRLTTNALRHQIALIEDITRSLAFQLQGHKAPHELIQKLEDYPSHPPFILAFLIANERGEIQIQNIYSPTQRVPKSIIQTWIMKFGPGLHSDKTNTITPPFLINQHEQIGAFLRAIRVNDSLHYFAVIVDLAPLLKEFVHPMRSGEFGAGYALDDQGNILYDHEKDIIGRNIFDGMHTAYPELAALDKRLVSQPKGNATYTFTIERGGTTSRKLTSWDSVPFGSRRIIVALAAPDFEVTDILSNMRRIYLLLGLLFSAALVFLVIGFFRARDTKALAKSELRLRRLAGATREGIAIHKAGNLAYANPQFYEMFGYSSYELKGTYFMKKLFTKSGLERVEKALSEDIPDSIETKGVRANGDLIPMEVWGRNLEFGNEIHENNHTPPQVLVCRDISHRKNIEAALKEQLAFTQSLINAIPNPIYFKDLNFTYLGCNDAFADFCGKPRQHVVGKTDAEIFVKNTAEIFQTMDKRMLITWKMKSGNFMKDSPEGESKSYDILVSPLRSADGGFIGVVGSMRDMTDRHRFATQLQTSEARHRAIFENSGLGIALLDLDGKILSSNSSLSTMLGHAPDLPETLQGENIESFVSFDAVKNQDENVCVLNAIALDKNQESCRTEAQLTHVHGHTLWVDVVLTMVRTRFGKPKYAIAMLRDIDARKNMETKLATLNRHLEQLVQERTSDLQDKAEKLEQANQELMELDQLKSSFLSSVSHELRTPLTSLLGFSKMIRKMFNKHFTPLTDEDKVLRRKADTINNNLQILSLEGERLTRLINNVLDLNKIKAGKMTWHDEFVSISNLVRTAVDASKGYQDVKPDIPLIVRMADNLPQVYVDADKIIQVFTNVLTNAYKYSEQGKIVVTVEAPVPEFVRIVVADTGRGIARDELQQVFDEFHQASRYDTLVQTSTGTGLGLPICKRNVEQYNGLIWAESTPGKGSCIFIELPVSTTRANAS